MQITIKRYPNRKLYNTHSKQYITLDEVGRLIRDDIDISVVDSISGENITAYIFTQIIVAQEKQRDRTIPQGLLAELIRASEDRLEVVRNLLHGSTDWFLSLVPPGIPSREDIDRLSGQINELARLIDELSEQAI
jgi:polyhydroxyalkanoate synthesis repressor PhaR